MTLRQLVEAMLKGSIWTEFVANTCEGDCKGLTLADSSIDGVNESLEKYGNEIVQSFSIASKHMIWVNLELTYNDALKKYWKKK